MPNSRMRAATSRAIPPEALGIEWKRIEFGNIHQTTIPCSCMFAICSLVPGNLGVESQVIGT